MKAVFDVVTVTLNPAIDRTLTIPNFAAGKVNRVEGERAQPGGKGVNVAAALADAGHRVAVAGWLGCDNARPFEELFAEKKIADHFVRVSGLTRTGLKISDPCQAQTTDINFPGTAPSPDDLAQLHAQLASLEAGWFVLSGSLPPGVDTALYRDLILALRARGQRVLLDISGAALPLALDAVPQILKPNLFELEEILGQSLQDESAVVAAMTPWLRRGVGLVAVSMGERGALFIENGKVVSAVPPKVEVLSTVGAGDAMVAGILSARLKGDSLSDCARRATAFAVDAITHPGAGLSSAKAIDVLMLQVVVRDFA